MRNRDIHKKLRQAFDHAAPQTSGVTPPIARAAVVRDEAPRAARPTLPRWALVSAAAVVVLFCGFVGVHLMRGPGNTPLQAAAKGRGSEVDPTAAVVTATASPIITPEPAIVVAVSSSATPELAFVGEDRARAVALEQAGAAAEQAEHLAVRLDREDGRWVYEVEFTFAGWRYEYEINAETGEIIQEEKKQQAAPESTPAAETVSEDRVRQIALSHVNATQVQGYKAELDRENGRLVYEVEFVAEGYEYDLEIDAETGKVLKAEKEKQREKKASSTDKATPKQTAASDTIGAQEAKRIALEKAGVAAGDAEGLKANREKEKGRTVYEVEFWENGIEYEYKIDAETGEVLSEEKERDRDDDRDDLNDDDGDEDDDDEDDD